MADDRVDAAPPMHTTLEPLTRSDESVLTSAWVVARAHPQIAALSHVVLALSAFLDFSRRYTLLNVVRKSDLRLVWRLIRLAAKDSSQYRYVTGIQATLAAEEAARNGDATILKCLYMAYLGEIAVEGVIE